MTRAERFRRLTANEHIRDDLRGKSVRAAAFTFTAGAGDFALRLGSTAVLARLVLPEHFGLVMMITAITSIADQFRDLGLSTVTVQRKDIGFEEISNLFWVNVAAGLFIAGIMYASAPFMAAYYNEPRLILPARVLASTFVLAGLMVQHQALLTRQLNLKATSTVRVASSLLSTALAVALAWWDFGYWALVWREVARCAILTIGMWACFPWLPGAPSLETSIVGLVRFGADLSVANIVSSISGASDRLLLGRFSGAAPMAMYRQAYQLIVLPTEQLLGPIYQVAQPGLAILQADGAKFLTFYKKVLTLACLAAMPLSLFVAVCSPEITRVMLGRRWAEAAPLLSILSLSTFIKQPVGSSAFVLVARGRSRTYLMLTILQNVATVAFMAVGVYWGATGIAMAEVAATYLLIAPRLHYTFRDSPVSTGAFLSTIARPAAASIVMGMVLLTIRQSLPAWGAPLFLLIESVAGVATFLGVWMLLPGGARELRDLIVDIRSSRLARPIVANTPPSLV